MNKKKAVNIINKKINDITNHPGFYKKGKPVFHQGNDIGVLLIHGFDNTPFIMNEYANIFINKGYTVYNILLPGRGFTLEDLAKTSWQEWVDSVKSDYFLLKNITKKIFIAAFSTGATISLYLLNILKKNEFPEGLLLLSPAIFFINRFLPLTFSIKLLQLYKLFIPFPKKLKKRDLVFKDPIARKKYDIIKKGSTNGMIELLKLAKEVKKTIKVISTPCFTVQSKKDIVVNHYGAKWIIKKCTSVYKKNLILHQSGHPVMVDLEKENVFEESLKFINSIIY